MANHQNTDTEREQLNQARQAFWLSALMHSPDVECAYQVLRQSVIKKYQSLHKSVDDMCADIELHATDGMSATEKEAFLRETRKLLLESNKSMGMDEQSLKIKLERELTELENIKNQAIATKKQRKTSFMIVIAVVLLITIGLYVLR